MVQNSAASPASTVMARSPSISTTVPDSTVNQSWPGWTFSSPVPGQADLDTEWPDIGPVDLVWASSSLHHLADPDRVLAQVSGALRPGGLLAVLEMDSFPRFLPEDPGVGQPGLEARCHAALAEQRAAELPHLGSDWGPRLSRAGLNLVAERTFAVHLMSPLPPATGRYARASLRRIREGLGGRLSAADRAALDTLIDSDGPAGVRQRDDLAVRTTRRGWLARASSSII